ncbi:MAG: type II toxin-antitoxin system RelE/ParE family toxin [Bacteroidota bacterium]
MRFIERKIIFPDSHFVDFYLEQSLKVQEKMEFVLAIIRKVERVSMKFLSPIGGTDGVYEVKVEYNSNIFRIFCCFDEGNVIVLFHGFQKKRQKTPLKEIQKAIKLKQEYFELKKIQENEKRSNKTR